MLRIITSEIFYSQSLIVPFNIEQAVIVDPIGDYNNKDGIDGIVFKRKLKLIFLFLFLIFDLVG